MRKFEPAFKYKMIYIFRINDNKHKDCLKIGQTTLNLNNDIDIGTILPNSKMLNDQARERINQYTTTAAIEYELLHTEIAAYYDTYTKQYNSFSDYDVHAVIKRNKSDVVKKFNIDGNPSEWFKINLSAAVEAINCIKERKEYFDIDKHLKKRDPIIFRPEQKEAIKLTIDKFKAGNLKMLWNAKMRFGKTLTALEVVKKMNFNKTLIITHRPVVKEGWFKDFKKIFYEENTEYVYSSKTQGEKIENLIRKDKKFVYFASIQDLRGSKEVGGNFDKNNIVFFLDWDLIIIDEGHEGTKTKLSKEVLNLLIKNNNNHKTYQLWLSGTPFNLFNDVSADCIYTWDYIMEQKAKYEWYLKKFFEPNPYSDLPRMNIFTYDLPKKFRQFFDDDKAFNFKEFFRVWTGNFAIDKKEMPNDNCLGKFIHEKDVKAFLDLMCSPNEDSNYPYSNEKYREYFRHSLWLVPGVKEAKALSSLLKKHDVLSNFNIINVAGDGDEEIEGKDALQKVMDGIGEYPHLTRTITISCGRLTTGVSIPAWTAVFMLSSTTSPSSYLQTIFRVQTPAKINGQTKEDCYVFDFAPDRTLKMVAEATNLSYNLSQSNNDRIIVGDFLNYCPVIAIDGSVMKDYDVSKLLQQLKKVYIEQVVKTGFESPKLYNDEFLSKLSRADIEKFNDLKKIVGASKQTKPLNEIVINKQNFDMEEYEVKVNELESKKELSDDEKAILEECKRIKDEIRKQKETARSILRAISIRMPLLIYGSDIELNTEITIDNFTDIVTDELSWEEFMPKGITKEKFKEFSIYYDKDVFTGAANDIRKRVLYADNLEPEERIKEIIALFETFKNPDKETVLTPWRVVNMHLISMLGGYTFYDEEFSEKNNELRFVEQENITNELYDGNSIFLEMNSKSGLYPLFIVFSIYQNTLKTKGNLLLDEKNKIWQDIVKNNIYVICKTPMAKMITKRTLLGYKKTKINSYAFDDLILQLKEKNRKFIEKIKRKSFWEVKGDGDMKFNVIVGNPPYQELVANNSKSVSQANPIYNLFVETASSISEKYVSMITPSLWMTGGTGLEQFRQFMLSNNRIIKLYTWT